MPACAIFLDRDGTINYDPGYIKDPGEVVILPGVAEGIRKLKVGFGFKIIVVSNQAGIAKGLMSHKDVEAVNRRILELLAKEKASVDAFYYCPFHPDFDPPEKTDCRKPSPFMIVKSAKDHEIDLSRSYMIGDKAIDVLSGINAGVKTILSQILARCESRDQTPLALLGGKMLPTILFAPMSRTAPLLQRDQKFGVATFA